MRNVSIEQFVLLKYRQFTKDAWSVRADGRRHNPDQPTPQPHQRLVAVSYSARFRSMTTADNRLLADAWTALPASSLAASSH